MIRLKSLLILVLALSIWSCEQPKEKQVKKPNILFLFADDYTFEAIHALGNEVIATPNLDRLVNGGTTFTHAYNMGGWNGAICVASRAMMISGRHVWRAQDISKKWAAGDSLSLQQTWGKLMENAGYSTYMTGKWHVEAPAETVFQVAKHIRPGMPNDYRGELGKSVSGIREALKNGEDISNLRPKGYYRPLSENDTSWSSSDPNNGGFWEGGKHWSEVVKDDALAFLDDAQKKENPFFMYIAFNAPHDPRQAPQSFLDKYPLEDIPLPENWLPEYPYKDDIGNSMGLRDEALAPFPRTELAIKTHRKEYYAIITHLDEQIGKILDALEASGELDNTYIFFTGDHGLAVGHHGLIGKQSLFDHSIRVPFMAMGPDLPAGNKVNNDIYLQDVMATSLELAGIEKPDYVEFNSFLSLAKNETKEGAYEQGIYGAYVNYQRMIRKDGYKLLVYPKINKVLLFDMNNDPMEMIDLSKESEHEERVKSMFEDLLELQEEMGDPLDLNDIYKGL
ncbi:sulfatase-like hydrolase/transferase [Echinicola sp. CAU 1574]|uniref:Sulfatase-like hydrolase/transferase n=1 Tax=Echinicola arenosa TaxID=2774144 RepID=A0ABR9AR96_9BACT|nr:sulfatase-like hydrolase/transferase [Echinicola arenosa]MBD8491303.1 sulfatase-like hydrolase/transferase [Echinicola arenosa]